MVWIHIHSPYFLHAAPLYISCIYEIGLKHPRTHAKKARFHADETTRLPSPKLSTTTHPFNLVCSHLLHLPLTHLTPYHRLFGRLVIPTLISLHSALYLMFFVENGVLEKRLNDPDVQIGIMGAWILVLLWGTSGWVVGWVRGQGNPTSRSSGSGSKLKRMAYVVHVALVIVLLGAVYFHVCEEIRGAGSDDLWG